MPSARDGCSDGDSGMGDRTVPGRLRPCNRCFGMWGNRWLRSPVAATGRRSGPAGCTWTVRPLPRRRDRRRPGPGATPSGPGPWPVRPSRPAPGGPPLLGARGPVHGGPGQRMAEADAGAELDETGGGRGRAGRRHVDGQPLRGGPGGVVEQRRPADPRLATQDQRPAPRRPRGADQLLEAPDLAAPARERGRGADVRTRPRQCVARARTRGLGARASALGDLRSRSHHPCPCRRRRSRGPRPRPRPHRHRRRRTSRRRSPCR